MNALELAQMTAAELVRMYIDLSLKEGDAIDMHRFHELRKLVRNRRAIDAVLRARGPEARRALVPLLSHRNAQVRLNAATELLAVVPEQARATLDDLAERGPSQQRGAAGMCLLHLEEGIFKPT